MHTEVSVMLRVYYKNSIRVNCLTICLNCSKSCNNITWEIVVFFFGGGGIILSEDMTL